MDLEDDSKAEQLQLQREEGVRLGLHAMSNDNPGIFSFNTSDLRCCLPGDTIGRPVTLERGRSSILGPGLQSRYGMDGVSVWCFGSHLKQLVPSPDISIARRVV